MVYWTEHRFSTSVPWNIDLLQVVTGVPLEFVEVSVGQLGDVNSPPPPVVWCALSTGQKTESVPILAPSQCAAERKNVVHNSVRHYSLYFALFTEIFIIFQTKSGVPL